MKEKENAQVVVAMSGGVDSSVAALLLAREGVPAIGVSMQVWDYRKNGGCASRATCCAPDDFTDARRVAAKVGIPYYVFDFEEHFRKEVIDRFVDSYKKAQTPNPCIDCNSRVKFRELRDRARRLGCAKVATGHYARIEERDGELQLLRGLDRAKDQSYFLYNLLPGELAETVFPVGYLSKDEVRELARQAGLVVAEKPESQDICFVSGSTKDFLVRLGGKLPAGDIVRQDGTLVGKHDGLHAFTVGQRRGLHLGGAEQPLYVLELQGKENRVVVGVKEELEREYFRVHEVNWISSKAEKQAQQGFRCRAQLRHRHQGVEVELLPQEGDALEVRFDGDWTTVSPGQAAVFYSLDDSAVLGGGRILPSSC